MIECSASFGQELRISGGRHDLQVGRREREFDAPRVLPDLDELSRHLCHLQHEIDHPGLNRAERHAVELGIVRTLRDGDAAELLETRQSLGAVAAGSGEHQTDGALAVSVRKAPEKQSIDLPRPSPAARSDMQSCPSLIASPLPGGMTYTWFGSIRHRLFGGQNRQLGRALQNRYQRTFVAWRQVHDDDESHPAVCRHLLEQPAQRRYATGRRADAHHRKLQMASRR